MKFLYFVLSAGAMALSFGAGFGAGHHWRSPQKAVTAPLGPTPTASSAPQWTAESEALAVSVLRGVNEHVHEVPSAPSWQALWTRLASGAQSEGTREAFEGLVAMAKADPKTLEQLLNLFERDADPNTRLLLKSLLSQIGGPEILDFSMKLATSDDPAKRRDGFDLLHRYPEHSKEVRSLIQGALTHERDPQALFNAVSALRPEAVAPEEAQQTIGLLRGLTQHSDPMVRRQSIISLAQWDGSADFVEPLREALSDEAPEVRQGAIWAAAEAGNRSEPVKTALLTVANDADEAPEIRSSALRVLERFHLNREEYASVSQDRTDLSNSDGDKP